MLRMPEFQVHLPTSAAEAARLCAALPDAMYVAGGTDLLPNLKHGLFAPKHLVSLAGIAELKGISRDDQGAVRVGAGTSLEAVAESLNDIPGLARAASLVAGPQHRRMGTLGGNVMLDTRCLYYNQSEHWRRSLGYCLKREGDWCHVVGSKATCVAAQSSDTVPVLIALGAELEVVTAAGPLVLPLRELYRQDGRRAHTLPEGALLAAIRIPPRPAGHRSAYRKVRSREAIDFPQLGVAVVADLEGGVVRALDLVVGAVMPRPREIKGTEVAVGTRLEDAVIDAVADAAFAQVRPQKSLHGEPAWRRHMARVETRRALLEIRG